MCKAPGGGGPGVPRWAVGQAGLRRPLGSRPVRINGGRRSARPCLGSARAWLANAGRCGVFRGRTAAVGRMADIGDDLRSNSQTVEYVILCRMCRKPDRQDAEEAVTISTELLVR